MSTNVALDTHSCRRLLLGHTQRCQPLLPLRSLQRHTTTCDTTTSLTLDSHCRRLLCRLLTVTVSTSWLDFSNAAVIHNVCACTHCSIAVTGYHLPLTVARHIDITNSRRRCRNSSRAGRIIRAAQRPLRLHIATNAMSTNVALDTHSCRRLLLGHTQRCQPLLPLRSLQRHTTTCDTTTSLTLDTHCRNLLPCDGVTTVFSSVRARHVTTHSGSSSPTSTSRITLTPVTAVLHSVIILGSGVRCVDAVIAHSSTGSLTNTSIHSAPGTDHTPVGFLAATCRRRCLNSRAGYITCTR